MKVYRIEADVSECQSIVFDIDDYLDVLDSSIGEKQAMFLPMVNLSITEVWSPIELAYFQNEGTVQLVAYLRKMPSSKLISNFQEITRLLSF